MPFPESLDFEVNGIIERAHDKITPVTVDALPDLIEIARKEIVVKRFRQVESEQAQDACGEVKHASKAQNQEVIRSDEQPNFCGRIHQRRCRQDIMIDNPVSDEMEQAICNPSDSSVDEFWSRMQGTLCPEGFPINNGEDRQSDVGKQKKVCEPGDPICFV